MPVERSEDETQPKSSAELIREARESLVGSGPGSAPGSGSNSGTTNASSHLMAGAREWLASADSDEMPASLPVVREGPSATDVEFDPAFATPPSRPVPRPSRVPAWRRTPGPISQPNAAGQRRRILGFAAVIGSVALLANVTALFSSQDDDPVTVTNAPASVVYESTGSIASASDPCSGATISGDLATTITYSPNSGYSEIEIEILGAELAGSDGSTYQLAVYGDTIGDPNADVFEFESTYMTMTRDDGLLIEDVATITVEVAGGEPFNWSYTTAGADCPG